MTSRKSIYMSKLMDKLLPISTLNLNSARKNIHWAEVWKVFNCHVYDVVNIIIYYENINKDIFKVFPRLYRCSFNKLFRFYK